MSVSPWGSGVAGNAYCSWPEEHWSEYPDGFADAANGTMSIGYVQMANGAGPPITVSNTTVQSDSIVISIMPVNSDALTEFSSAGAGSGNYWAHSTANNVVGVSFQIDLAAAIAVANPCVIRYWLLHPAWK